jgi:hypothetical protein
MPSRRAALALLLLALAGCTATRQTSPQRTATEELLISTAADRAAAGVDLALPAGSKVFVDAANVEGLDSKYAVAAMRDRILRQGGRLVADRGAADVVVELRSGALSIDEESFLIGIPSIDIPVPLAGSPAKTPEIALFKRAQQQGVAKFAAIGYSAKDGTLIAASDPQYGFAHRRHYVLLLVIGWTTNDLVPAEQQDQPDPTLRSEPMPPRQ